MNQQELWHETTEDALADVVSALGGWKKVGPRLWPALPIDDAARKLMHCLDRGKANKLSPDELIKLLLWGREAECHVAAAFINRAAGYAPPVPISPETESERLMREFIDTGKRLERIQQQLASTQNRRRGG